jgi:SPP1 family predicted phage head-tail adaptor
MSGRMRAGLLRNRVQLQRKTRTSDGQGGWTETWTTYDTTWARVRPLSVDEHQAAMQPDARARYEVTIRANTSTVAGPDRVLFGSKVLDVIGPPVNMDEREKFLSFPAAHDSEEDV